MLKLSSDIDAKMMRGVIVDYCSDEIPGFKKQSSGAQLSWLDRFIKRHDLREYVARYEPSAQPSKKELKLSLSEVSTASSETIVHVEAPSQDTCAVVDSSNQAKLDAPPLPAPAIISLVHDTKEGVNSGDACDDSREVEVADIVLRYPNTVFCSEENHRSLSCPEIGYQDARRPKLAK
ncbi:unnamed protein product [Phytophthora fragariaefolia]|uniref:Unnamed protein product n=1 Tax=Phytophthora fragariaefolia TaxID=1490495 RepID=A0A9W6XV89_9STRA|nr:unnamed protein product [Phytophthora fragariaefolia]